MHDTTWRNQSVTNTDVLIFLPFAIAVWAFADVPVTNVLGANAAASLAVLDDPVRLRRMFTVRDLSLWILISPACVVLSLALLPSQGHTPTSIAVIFAVNALPFGYMGVASPLAPLACGSHRAARLGVSGGCDHVAAAGVPVSGFQRRSRAV